METDSIDSDVCRIIWRQSRQLYGVWSTSFDMMDMMYVVR